MRERSGGYFGGCREGRLSFSGLFSHLGGNIGAPTRFPQFCGSGGGPIVHPCLSRGSIPVTGTSAIASISKKRVISPESHGSTGTTCTTECTTAAWADPLGLVPRLRARERGLRKGGASATPPPYRSRTWLGTRKGETPCQPVRHAGWLLCRRSMFVLL